MTPERPVPPQEVQEDLIKVLGIPAWWAVEMSMWDNELGKYWKEKLEVICDTNIRETTN